jgi:hypothetical protein
MQGLLPVCASIVEPNIPHQKSVTTAFHENINMIQRFLPSQQGHFSFLFTHHTENSDESPIGTRPFLLAFGRKSTYFLGNPTSGGADMQTINQHDAPIDAKNVCSLVFWFLRLRLQSAPLSDRDASMRNLFQGKVLESVNLTKFSR